MIKPQTGFGHPNCYAQALNDCSTTISGEHWVSETILESVEHGRGRKSRGVRTRNLAFQQRDVRQMFGIGSLKANILCTNHNSRLSPLDCCGKAMFDAMETVHYECETPDASTDVISVDGDLFERFLLKVMCGGLFSGNLRHSSFSMKGQLPPLQWLKTLFDGAAFPARHGLYYMPKVDLIVANHDVLDFSPFFSEDLKTVCGIRSWFFGIEFDLLFASIQPGVRTSFYNSLYRPAGLRVKGSDARIEFTWNGGPGGQEILLERL
jgi:hypothetical protein